MIGKLRDWKGRVVSCWDGEENFDSWEFHEEFPWIVNGEVGRGLEFVSTDWTQDEDGEWEMVQIGVTLDDLIDFYIESQIETKDDDWKEAKDTISCLERQIEKIKKHIKTY